MSPALELALFVIEALLLAAASAVAGALWFRQRARPRGDAAGLARELAERQRELETRIARLEEREPRPARPRIPQRIVAPAPPRVDRGGPAVPGPTLIAVPDLSARGAIDPASAADELARRFGDLWGLADAGEPAEAIARRYGYPIGQVELILGLRRGLAASEGRP